MFNFLWKFSKEKWKAFAKIKELEDQLANAEKEKDILRENLLTLEVRLKNNPKPRNIRKNEGCGKICFGSSAQAKKANSRHKGRIRTYHCDICYKWHVTTKRNY